MLLEDGSIVPCAIKRAPYNTSRQREKAQLELAALHAALGVPNLVQCLAAFKHKPPNGPASIVILTKCVPVLLLQLLMCHTKAYQLLQAFSSLQSSFVS